MPSDAAEAMKPLAGQYAFILFAAGLFNASLFAASILPLSTAYTVCEGLGFESGVDKSFQEAPFFYWLYTLLIVAGAAVVLIPNFPLVKMSILSQVLNGVLLPLVLIFMLKLINKKELMGKYTNSRLVQLDGVGDGGDRDWAVAGAGAATSSSGSAFRFAISSLPSARSRMRSRSAARKS